MKNKLRESGRESGLIKRLDMAIYLAVLVGICCAFYAAVDWYFDLPEVVVSAETGEIIAVSRHGKLVTNDLPKGQKFVPHFVKE